MRILIVAATLPEIAPLLNDLKLEQGENHYKNQHVTVLITGVGMVATAFAMGKCLASSKFDLALNLGIAGSFDRNFRLGDVVHITRDRFSELGAEDGENFITIDELGFGKQWETPQPTNHNLQLAALKKVSSITVNTIHGKRESISKIMQLFAPQAESMEGAAFFYACNQAGLASVQIRAISNYVERRNREAWEISLAIKNLTIFAVDFINELFIG